MDTNVLYYGDNLDVLRKHIPDESINLLKMSTESVTVGFTLEEQQSGDD